MTDDDYRKFIAALLLHGETFDLKAFRSVRSELFGDCPSEMFDRGYMKKEYGCSGNTITPKGLAFLLGDADETSR